MKKIKTEIEQHTNTKIIDKQNKQKRAKNNNKIKQNNTTNKKKTKTKDTQNNKNIYNN